VFKLARGFELGDIVSLRLLGEKHYYIIVDHVDYSQEGDEQPNIKHGTMLIYPVIQSPKVEYVDENELNHVADFKSRDYKMLMEYIKKERERAGWFVQPEYLRIVGDDTIKYATNGGVKEVVKPVQKKKVVKYGETEIRKILNNNHTEIVTEEYVGRMNTHLDLLSLAIEKGDDDNIKLQMEQLEKVRAKLMELEYFKLSERRNGTSIKIK
jgi:hypothetical protein